MAESERRVRGKEMMEQVAGIPDLEPADDFMALNLDQVFGELWTRPGLPTRERRLLSLAVVGARGLEFEVRTHIAGALRSGDVGVEEMLEAILHIAHYAGWLTNGNGFDASYDRGSQPSRFPLGNLIKGWQEGMQLMGRGAKFLFVVPPDLGYGSADKGNIPPNSTLVFVVELIDFG